jgi:uncharacterized protein YkwD
MGDTFSRCSCDLPAVLKYLLSALAATLILTLPATASAGLSQKESAVLREMNRVRAQQGLAQLRYEEHLQRAARAHTREMIVSNVFTHGAFGARMQHFGVVASIAGENIAWGTGPQGTARAIVAAWLASPGHRANLLRPSFRRVGVGDLLGTFLGYRGAHVVTVDFAS